MPACKLVIGERTVLESTGGPPDAEYALFDSGTCELQATEPGTIREVGYRSKVGDARQRLAGFGITAEIAEQLGAILQPALAQTYARGAAVRRAAAELGPAELFDGGTYDAKTKVYAGGWLDLAALAKAIKVARASALMQALFLAAILAEQRDDTPLLLSTLEHTRTRRPGERSFRRPALEGLAEVEKRLRALAVAPPQVDPDRASGPSRAALLDAVKAREASSSSDKAREHLASLARVLSVREPPPRGPLADAELWPLETQLALGETTGVAEKLDAIERARGRLPATMYLRARLALQTKSEEPRAIAERMSALSQSMASFFELELLAARAWLAAGEDKRGKAFARDLVENPSAPDELRVAALEVLEGAPASSTKPATTRSSERPRAEGRPRALPLDSRRELETAPPDTAIDPQPVISVPPPPPDLAMPAPPKASSRPPPPPPPPRDPRAKTLSSIPPPPDALDAHRESARQKVTADWGAPRPAPTRGLVEEHVIEVQGEAVADADEGVIRGQRPRRSRTDPPPVEMAVFSRGASRPPFQSDAAPPPPPLPPTPSLAIPPPPPLPRDRVVPSEAAETLSLPPGLHGLAPPLDVLPQTAFEARVSFTFLSRELGREYRARFKIELRTDVASLEVVQRQLRERFPEGKVVTAEERLEVRRHGAFLSEILARALGAYWVDVAPSELGYWAMIVPPSTRIWPFGRLSRFISMGHRERDLVSYYLELDARARR